MRITLGGEPLTGTTIDLRDDLDLDPALAYGLRAAVAWRDHRVRLAYEPVTFSGEATLPRAVVFHGQTYPAGERVEAEVRTDFVIAGYEHRVACSRRAEAWAGVAGYLWEFDSRLEGEGSGLDESRGFRHFFPAATGAGRLDLGDWVLRGEVAAGGLGSDRYVVDAEASVGRRCFRDRVEVDLGWGMRLLEFHETTNEATIFAHGPFLQVGVDF
jgi:hypothetical protein